MGLDTVLKIGNALRNAPNSLRHFKYVSPCPTDRDGNHPFCISIPVLEDFSFDWTKIKVTQENEREKLFYLKFKTSDSDGLMKYLFGDIYYQKTAKIKKDGTIEKGESGGYRMANPNATKPYQPSSFNRGNGDHESIVEGFEAGKLILTRFRTSLQKDLTILETILDNISAVEHFVKNPTELGFFEFIHDPSIIEEYAVRQLMENTSKANLRKLGLDIEKGDLDKSEMYKLLEYDNGEIFIHFEFPYGKHWYEFQEDFNRITQKMLSDFVDNSGDGLVLKKTLYKTLCSGDKKNDIQFPGFSLNSKHKSKQFSNETIQDLFYAVDYSKKGTLIPGTDIKIIVLPRGKNLSADDYIEFKERQNEEKVKSANNQNVESDPLFDIFEIDEKKEITSFDVIFSKKGGTTSPDVDLSEISGIEKSNIRKTKQRIFKIASTIYQKRKKYFLNTTKDFYGFRISSSFRNVLGSPLADMKTGKVSFKANPKYKSHLLKVLPLIYTDNYYSDDRLFYAFIQNVEFTVRAGDPRFNFLKFDIEFLISIQNNQNNKYMDIINSESYQIGNLLGSLAKNFAGDKSPIKSFEKNYVGNLSRRISTMDDFIRLKNDIEQKLIMHEKANFTYRTSYDLAQRIKEFKGSYDREQCAFGFFESYFKPLPKKKE